MNIYAAALVMALGLATAVQTKIAAFSWPSEFAFNWSNVESAVQPICQDAELTVGCVLAMAN
jgi:hypothetical protein